MAPDRESLTVEFKSERDCLSDGELVEAVTCLANTEGGVPYSGVEDAGTPIGLHCLRVGEKSRPAGATRSGSDAREVMPNWADRKAMAETWEGSLHRRV